MSSETVKAGDKITVNLGRRGGVQSGTVVCVRADGRIVWRNACNLERTARPEDLTTEPERAGKLDPYMQKWLDEPGE